MANYTEQISSLKELFEKSHFDHGTKCCGEQLLNRRLNLGIIGVNITDHSELINKISNEVSNADFYSIRDNGCEPGFSTGCDAVLQVIDAVQPVTRGDLELYRNLSKYYINIIFAVSRVKYVDEDEVEELQDYIKQKLSGVSQNKMIVYTDNHEDFVKLTDYIKTMAETEETKSKIADYKLKAFCSEGLQYIKEKIYLLDNWETEKSKKINDMKKQIDEMNHYGEGFTLFFNRYEERVQKYMTATRAADRRYLEFCLKEFTSCIQTGCRKYLNSKIDGINSLVVTEDKYLSSPVLYIEEVRSALKKSIHNLINDVTVSIEKTCNEKKNEEDLALLRECCSELMHMKEEIDCE